MMASVILALFTSFLYAQDSTGTVIDSDGNVYKTIKIGNQWWTAENLKVTHYQNGDSIPNVTVKSEWKKLKTGAYCAYDNNENYVNVYGYLYNWHAVNDIRKIAPVGWHVPTDEEWKNLEGYLGSKAADKLKETGTTHWASPNQSATNESGFSALPGGFRYYDGSFNSDVGFYAAFWSATEGDNEGAWYCQLFYGFSIVSRLQYKYCKQSGLSVRLVRD